jgi:predicted deacylase
MARPEPFEIGGVSVPPGGRRTVELPVSVLSNHSPVVMPLQVVHGRRAGPTLFVSAAVHGDEIIGVEIIRRLLRMPAVRRLHGTLLAIPIVNSFGFISHSRYLPDRRDLNRSFPGSAKGSLAGQLAHLFLNQIVKRSDFGIDLHSAAIHRSNLPQIRISDARPELLPAAKAFGAPVILSAPLRDGSLRAVAQEAGVDVLVYEAGEGLRFDELAVRAGVTGILRVMKHLGMVARSSVADSKVASAVCTSSHWIRAPEGGVFRAFKTTGAGVVKDEVIGAISDPFGEVETEIRGRGAGLVIGRSNLPVVNQGDALFHVAELRHVEQVESRLEQHEEQLRAEPLFDEDEIL